MSRVATASRAVLAFQADTLSAFARPIHRPAEADRGHGLRHQPGGLKMFAYVPQNLPRQAPLVVVLHGCRQNAEEYERGAGWTHMARERGFALLYAAAPSQQSECLFQLVSARPMSRGIAARSGPSGR